MQKLFAGALLTLGLIHACSSGDGSPAAAGTHDAGADLPVLAPFGLDVRPSNSTCLAKPRPTSDAGVALQQMWKSLVFDQPLYLAQAPGDDTRWYEVERQGKVRSFAADATRADQMTDLVSVAVNTDGEGGLLGLAFHPDWQANHEAYLSYTRDTRAGDPGLVAGCNVSAPVFTSVVARYRSTDGGASLGAPDEILKLAQPYNNHNGGNIQFSPFDRMLYIGFGDGGAGNDICGSGQSLTSKLGKILRIDPNAPAGTYAIPADNPFASSTTAAKEIWSYGFRNPWRWSFDRASGELWAGDVGQGAWEEIDRVVKGGNYGWGTCEGFHRLGSTTALCDTPGLLGPVVEHPRSEAQSITGGHVYRGTALPGLIGTYIYGDFVTGNVWALTYLDGKPVPKLLLNVGGVLASFAQGNDGELYTVQISGVISKLVPSEPGAKDTFPQLLSQTGCVDPDDPTKPAAGLVPYDVNSPLWSDGAQKERFLALPDNTTIDVGVDNDWSLPVGAVTVKTFSIGGKRIETRLFMRHDDGGWAGYTYEWNEAGTDATLLPTARSKLVGDQVWSYPSRTQCLQCHSIQAGGTLGLETWQLNRDVVYPSTNRRSNALATLDHIGMFTRPLGDAAALPRLADPAGPDPVDVRARSYLHANCSHCHRPGAGGQGTLDLRFGQAFFDTQTCALPVTQGNVGVASKIIVPGDPSMSALSLRVHATDSQRMPPVAVSLLDPVGSKAIDEWIGSLTACP